MTWQDRAACRGLDPAMFFPEAHHRGGAGSVASRELTASARQVCQTCPVRVDCLRTALHNRERYGVWGGLLFSADHSAARLYRRAARLLETLQQQDRAC